MEAIQIPWPFWRMQYQLLGGHRRVLLMCSGYLLLLIVASITIRRVQWEQPVATVVDWLIYALASVQGVILYAGGAAAIHRATLRDYQTRMSESHRLSPMSSVGVALGYLLGPTVQVILMWVVGLFFGIILQFFVVSNLLGWVIGNLQMFAGAIMLWSLVMLIGVGQTKPVHPNGLLVVAGSLSVPAALFLPGAALFMGAYSVFLGYWRATGAFKAPASAFTISIAGNLLITAFWIYVTAAKFRRPDLPVFNAYRGLLLLLLWLLVAFGGVVSTHFITNSMPNSNFEIALPDQWIATLIASLVVAAFPIAGAVQTRKLLRQGAAPRDWTDRVSDEAVLLIAIALLLGIALLGALTFVLGVVDVTGDASIVSLFRELKKWWLTFAAVTLANITLWSVVRLSVARLQRPGVWIGVFILLAWGFPPLIDLTLAGTVRGWENEPVLSSLFAISPAGAIIAIWENFEISVVMGILVQAAIAVGFAALAIRENRWWGSASPAINSYPATQADGDA